MCLVNMMEHRLSLLLDDSVKKCVDAILKLDPGEPSFVANFAVLKGRYTGFMEAKQCLVKYLRGGNIDGDED